MKPSELLAREPVEVSHSFDYLYSLSYDFLPQIWLEPWALKGVECERLEVKVYKDRPSDARRYWRLASVWLDGVAVMACCNAGREGADYVRGYVFNAAKYQELLQLAGSLAVRQLEVEVTDMEEDIPELAEFYGGSLDCDY